MKTFVRAAGTDFHSISLWAVGFGFVFTGQQAGGAHFVFE
jgi:hypothetical protein